MEEKYKVAGFALVDDFKADNLKKMGEWLYKKNIIPAVIGLKKGRNVVDKDKTMMTEIDLTFNRARAQIDVLVIADDYSVNALKNHEPFKKLVEKMVQENQPVVAMGKGPLMLAETKVAKNRGVTGNKEAKAKLKTAGANIKGKDFVRDKNLVTASSIDEWQKACGAILKMTKTAA